MAEKYRSAGGDSKDLGGRIVTEGLGVATGFGLAGVTGYTVESKFSPDIAPTSSARDKFTAYMYNNVPKALIWLGMKMKGPTDVRDMSDELWIDIEKGIVGSISIDTVLRLLNSGAPPNLSTCRKILSKSDHQRLIQENSALRGELNKYLRQMSEWRNGNMQLPTSDLEQVPPIPPVETTEASHIERQKGFGFMPTYDAPPVVKYREDKYGFMKSDEEKDITTMFGMR